MKLPTTKLITKCVSHPAKSKRHMVLNSLLLFTSENTVPPGGKFYWTTALLISVPWRITRFIHCIKACYTHLAECRKEGNFCLALHRKQEKPQGHWTPPFFPLPSGCKIHYSHSRCEPKWCTFLKLVIYLTIDVFVAICPPPSDILSAPFSLW